MAHGRNLRDITDFELLLQYLQDNLEWPLQDYKLEEVTFTYEPAELGLKEEDAVKVRSIKQLRPLVHGQPWGIFFVEFEKKKLPVVLLRRILSHLVLKKRASANNADRARWDAKDLLFVSRFGAAADQELAFAHFKESMGDLPTLNVLGWDGGDTVLKLDHLQRDLEDHLHWPDDATNVDAWRKEWSTPFKHGVSHTIKKSDELAEVLAELARRIRDAATALMKVESEKGPLRRMHAAFKTALIHDLTEEGFADTYAQTITYGLLTAAISRTDMQGGKHGTALVADNVADMVPITNPFLKEMLQSFLKVGGRRGGIDFDELGVQDVVELLRSDDTDLPLILEDFGNKTQGEDPVIHFYEHFLAKYNKKLKVERGVFYTPKPVVGYIVRSVDELLRTEFGIEDGLASTITWREMALRNVELKIPEGTEPDSPFVMVLDPATGTATFLVEVIDLVHSRLKENWGKGKLKAMPKLPATTFSRGLETFQDYWNSYVALSLLRRLHGYELMMAPYAIAHMKIGLKLWETGYRFGTEERARVYLTNALEPPNERIQLSIADWASALAHEAEAVNRIKREMRFTVVLGNPPYSKLSGNLSPSAVALVEPFRFADGSRIVEKGALALELNLQDDYVKFWGLLGSLMHRTGTGVASFITNSRYLSSSSLRGLRGYMRERFSHGYFVNLGGQISERKALGVVDDNVFEIEQGVAIGCLVYRPASVGMSSVHYERITGTERDKHKWLRSSSVSAIANLILLSPPKYRFSSGVSDMEDEFNSWPPLDRIMPFNSGCIITSRDKLALDVDRNDLLKKIGRFANSAKGDQIIEKDIGYSVKAKWDVERCKAQIRGLSKPGKLVQRILYRPFDSRYIFYLPSLLDTPSRPVCEEVFDRENLVLLTPGVNTSSDFTHVLIAETPAEKKACSHDRATQMFPLYSQGGPLLTKREVNMIREFLGGRNEKHVLAYIYAVLHSPNYRSRYGDALRDSYPRVPPPSSLGDRALFEALSAFGTELIGNHLLKSPVPGNTAVHLQGSGGSEVVRVGWSEATVWIDAKKTSAPSGHLAVEPGTTGFSGVPEQVWHFHIGGYQVCHKFLDDRKGRTLSAEDITHYQKIVVALSETIRIQKEIDEVIEQHGGWPGAFVTNAPLAQDPSTPRSLHDLRSTPSELLRVEPVAQPKAKKPKATKDQEPDTSPGYIPDPGEIPFG